MNEELSKIEEAIQALKEGRIIIVVDDEDRENEGDFVAAAEKVTPETVEFMITHGRGQLCMPIMPDTGGKVQSVPLQTQYFLRERVGGCPSGCPQDHRVDS